MKRSISKFVLVFAFFALLAFTYVGVYADEEYSDEFLSLLNSERKFEIKAVKPNDEMELMLILWDLFTEDEIERLLPNFEYISEELDELDFTIHCGQENEETHTVEIYYNYDEDLKSIVDTYTSRIPADLQYFYIKDMEVVNFWVNGKGNEENLISYSSELKSYFDYKNFDMELKNGNDDDFGYAESLGQASFIYDGTIYGVRNPSIVRAEYVLYVDDDIEDTTDAIMEAVKTRIDRYMGEGKVQVSFVAPSVYDYYITESDNLEAEYRARLATLQAQIDSLESDAQDELNSGNMEEFSNIRSQIDTIKNNEYYPLQSMIDSQVRQKQEFIDSYNNQNGKFGFLNGAVLGNLFKATIGNEEYFFVIRKDSSKMIDIIDIKTCDFATNIMVSTSDTIPLDTKISVEQLVSGEEYDRIINALGINDNDSITFDIKLYSNSLGQYITSLEDGTFEVKMPVPANLQDKEELGVYYVDSDGNIEYHEVEVDENGYAVFTTSHFSIYTLTEKIALEEQEIDDEPDTGVKNYLLLVGMVALISLFGIYKLNKED